MYPFGNTKKDKKRFGTVLGLVGLAFLLQNRASATNAPEQSISRLNIYYYNATVNEFIEDAVRNGSSFSGSAMGIELRFTDASERGSSVRMTYNAKKDGATISAGTKTQTLSPGESGNFFLEPSEYGGTSMGVDTVDFVVEVLPPQTGGVPQEGESYPTYRFAYRL